MTSIGHSARRVLLAATMVALTACSVFEDNPYADFSIGKVDEKSAQTAAAILVGDPQVISRETLINDRLREVRHLEFMLQEKRLADLRASDQAGSFRDRGVCRAPGYLVQPGNRP